jgi:predicted transcriptional regulator of viral defense system
MIASLIVNCGRDCGGSEAFAPAHAAIHYVGTLQEMPTKRFQPGRSALDLARKQGVVRLRELEQAGISKAAVLRACESGELERIARGLYALPGREVTESEALVQVAKRVPAGVVCLLTALRFHNLTDQNPSQVWLAIDRKARAPTLDWPPLEVVYWSRAALEFGVVQKVIGGVKVRITSPAKTVADCLKYRNKLGRDVAVAALRDYGRSRRSMDELFRAARVCRVEQTLRTYLEVMA